jgi:hypothetical protein
MSEDEQCGRWETTPHDMKLEIRLLREALGDVVRRAEGIEWAREELKRLRGSK